tara:strand:- start:581 stop:988 length:408 start_codon:yes stop_codon:yes gene_type:complete
MNCQIISVSIALGLFIPIAVPAQAHPMPEIPVETNFEGEEMTIKVTIDPRSFTEDPLTEPYMHFSEFQQYDEERIQLLKVKGQELVDRTVVFNFESAAKIEPVFEFSFASLEGTELSRLDDPVMLVVTVEVTIPD